MDPSSIADMPVTIMMPQWKNTGWGICGSNLHAVARRKLEKWEVIEEDVYAERFRPTILAPILEPTLKRWPPQTRGGDWYAYGFIENNLAVSRYIPEAINSWRHISCGSSWMRDTLREAGYLNCSVAIQGVDHIAADNRIRRERRKTFTVFSGGKFEFRKAQDIVIAAMKILMAKHKDIFLSCAWGNPSVRFMNTMQQSHLITYTPTGGDWVTAISKMLHNNGLPLDRCLVSPAVDHSQMQQLYLDADIGIFPNRCEGGTNLVAMEAIACELPTIVSYCSGHRDIVEADSLLALHPCQEVDVFDDLGISGRWDEVTVVDLVEKVEEVYRDYNKFVLIAQEHTIRNKKYTWERTLMSILTGMQASS